MQKRDFLYVFLVLFFYCLIVVILVSIATRAELGSTVLAVNAVAVVLLEAILMCVVCVLAVVAAHFRELIHLGVEADIVNLTGIVPLIDECTLNLPHGYGYIVPTIQHSLLGLELLHRNSSCLVIHTLDTHTLIEEYMLFRKAPAGLAIRRRPGAMINGTRTNGLDRLILLKAHTPGQGLTGVPALYGLWFVWCSCGLYETTELAAGRKLAERHLRKKERKLCQPTVS